MSDIAPAVPGSRRGKGCLFGCGVGCLVVLALLGAAVYVGFRFYGEFMRKFESEGYDRVEGQVIEVARTITNRTIFAGQMVKITRGSERGIAILAQTAEIDGRVVGNVRFVGQMLTVKPGAVLERDLDVMAQVVNLYGTVAGKVTGVYQVICTNAAAAAAGP